MKANVILLWILICVQYVNANMASPIRGGTIASTAITSKDIAIASEKIQIKIDEGFTTAHFIVTYNIKSEYSGKQIPLLFYAKDYADSFYVWLDDKRIAIQNIPDTYDLGATLEGFGTLPNRDQSLNIGHDNILHGYGFEANELKYFEANIEKGAHTIRVEYIAKVWTDISDWVKLYSFYYSLSPAKHWKSFGTLEVEMIQAGKPKAITTNLGIPKEKQIQASNTWVFDSLPGEYIEIAYQPPLSPLAATLIAISPTGIAAIATIAMVMLHIFLTIRYRKRSIQSKYSPYAIIGSLLIPFLALLVYMFSYRWIDVAIGKDAGNYHGYTFLVMVFYPILLIVYGLIVLIVDVMCRRKAQEM